GGPVRRAGHARFLRNVLVAAGNSGEAALVPAMEPLLAHGSPLVRGMAVWALRRLMEEEEFDRLKRHHSEPEEDAAVVSEWQDAT
ncbi:MAG: HEAT repeat domain-containing protein, partial [Candidatus Puniceispirillaceae bacterium]